MKKRPLIISVVLVSVIVLLWIWNLARKDSSPPIVTLEEKDAVETMQYRYTFYSKTAFDGAAGKTKRVYFFTSAACATCTDAHTEFFSPDNPETIPDDVVVFRTDMDVETELKNRYTVSVPHTFVQVDENDAVVATWTGGGIRELKERIK